VLHCLLQMFEVKATSLMSSLMTGASGGVPDRTRARISGSARLIAPYLHSHNLVQREG
jgi:hypothetical protein